HGGQGASATVLVQWTPASLVLQADDDCRGAAATSAGDGHGVLGMRERAQMLGGTLTAGPREGGGFRVRAEIPVPAGAPVEPQQWHTGTEQHHGTEQQHGTPQQYGASQPGPQQQPNLHHEGAGVEQPNQQPPSQQPPSQQPPSQPPPSQQPPSQPPPDQQQHLSPPAQPVTPPHGTSHPPPADHRHRCRHPRTTPPPKPPAPPPCPSGSPWWTTSSWYGPVSP